jgi:hypothetical protein
MCWLFANNDDSGRDTFAAQWLLHLAAESEIFQNPAGTISNLPKIFAKLLPHVTFDGMTENEDWPETHIHQYSAGDFQFEVYVSPIQVWLDISENQPGRGGSAVYAGIASFAFNTGRRFIGDPEGLSAVALRRRTDAMLCSALKHGSTNHLAPHPYQVEGDVENGVPALAWRHGHTLDNIQSLIETGVQSLAHCVPEISHASFSFESNAFQDANGRPLLDSTLASWGDQLARGGEARAGVATFKRCLLLRSLVRQKGDARSALLEQVLCEPSQFLESGQLGGIFY